MEEEADATASNAAFDQKQFVHALIIELAFEKIKSATYGCNCEKGTQAFLHVGVPAIQGRLVSQPNFDKLDKTMFGDDRFSSRHIRDRPTVALIELEHSPKSLLPVVACCKS